MGVGVSGWPLARAVSTAGQLGVVSGVGLDTLVARRLQLGDEGGHLRRALSSFPYPAVAERVLRRYFVDGGIGGDAPFAPVPRVVANPGRAASELTITANFAEIFLAKDGHQAPVGVNYMEKLQMATPAAVYGAMLAGVDYVLMGAGIPAAIPALLDAFAEGRPGEIAVDVQGDGEAPVAASLDPEAVLGAQARLPRRPRFLAVVASHMLAAYLARDDRTRPDGFVVEGPGAGGHNAPPRGHLVVDPDGQPVYGPRDRVDLHKMSALGLPYWLAGGYASPKCLREAIHAGAEGIQVGSAFALCEESGLDPGIKGSLVERALGATLRVRTDPLASPTGFPLKVAQLPGTLAEATVHDGRRRVCDVGYLRVPYRQLGGGVGYRCPAEPVRAYARKDGKVEDTEGRLCLCNGLIAAVGLGQRRNSGGAEPAVVTIGDDLSFLPALVGAGAASRYEAGEVIRYLLDGTPEEFG